MIELNTKETAAVGGNGVWSTIVYHAGIGASESFIGMVAGTTVGIALDKFFSRSNEVPNIQCNLMSILATTAGYLAGLNHALAKFHKNNK